LGQGKIKRERREKRLQVEAVQQKIRDAVDNVDISNMTEQEQETALKKLLDNEDTCQYMIAKAYKDGNAGVVSAIRTYKATGILDLGFEKETAKPEPA
jgi:hypothetical protein